MKRLRHATVVRSAPRAAIRCLAFAVLLGVYTPTWSAATDDYRSGIEAFKQGRYADARDYFIRAYDAGRRDPTIFYNLGSAQFKLDDYTAARHAFEQIGDDPTWGPLAQYNLGLIEDNLLNTTKAQQHYRVAYATTPSEKLRHLAALKIVGPAPAMPTDDGWFGIVSMATGYDDNVVLLNDQSLIGVSNKQDNFAEVLASASGFVQGNVERGWRADVVGYYRGYRDLSDFDYGTAALGLTYNTLTPTAQWQVGGRANVQLVGGDPYSTMASLRAQVLRRVGAFSLRLRNDAGYVEGDGEFGYLTGWQNRLSVQLDRRIGSYSTRLGYELELNNRDDSATTTEFFSYSPTWNRIYADVTRTLSDRFDVQVRAEYQIGRYADENIEMQADGSTVTAKRDDDRVNASLRLTHHISAAWDAFGEYAYSNNSSNFSQYEYQDNQLTIGIERLF